MGSYLRIRGGSGIGDALYVQSIARELVNRGEKIEICTDYPELFPLDAKFAPFSRHNIDILAHYSRRRREVTNQWQDVQIESGVEADLKIDWEPKNKPLIRSLPSEYIFVVGGRLPMNRKDGLGRPLIPDAGFFKKIMREIGLPTVLVGKGDQVFDPLCDIDLTNKTSLEDMMDIASRAKMFFGQISFIIPLAESFDKELLCIWSSRQPKSDNWVIQHLTPHKVLSKKTSKYLYDEVC